MSRRCIAARPQVQATSGRRGDEGTSLAELLVAITILGVAMSALVGGIGASVRAVGTSQHEHDAANAATAVVEQLRGGDWADVQLYTGEIAAPGRDGDRWRARLDPGGTFEGHALVLVDGPTVGRRDQGVPRPWRPAPGAGEDDGLDLDLYVTWVDRSGDGVVDTKRVVAFVGWSSPFGERRELRFDTERVPTQDEARSTATGARLLRVQAAPSPALVEEDGTVEPVVLSLRANAGLASGEAVLRWRRVVRDAEGRVVGSEPRTQALSLDLGGHVTGEGFTTGTATWTAPSDPTPPVDEDGPVPHPADVRDGVVDVVFRARTLDGQMLGGTTSLGLVAASDVSTPTPVVVDVVVLGTPCVEGDGRLADRVRIRAVVDHATQASGDPGDATVTVTLPRWDDDDRPSGTTTLNMDLASGGATRSTWELLLLPGDPVHLRAGEPLTPIVDVVRAVDGRTGSGSGPSVTPNRC